MRPSALAPTLAPNLPPLKTLPRNLEPSLNSNKNPAGFAGALTVGFGCPNVEDIEGVGTGGCAVSDKVKRSRHAVALNPIAQPTPVCLISQTRCLYN